jgi:hypothetical protein
MTGARAARLVNSVLTVRAGYGAILLLAPDRVISWGTGHAPDRKSRPSQCRSSARTAWGVPAEAVRTRTASGVTATRRRRRARRRSSSCGRVRPDTRRGG